MINTNSPQCLTAGEKIMLFWDTGNENMSVTCKMPIMPHVQIMPLLDVYGIHICIMSEAIHWPMLVPCIAYHTSCLKHWCDPYMHGSKWHNCPKYASHSTMQIEILWGLRHNIYLQPTVISLWFESEWHDPYMIEVWTIQMQLQYQLGVNLILRFLWPTCGAYMQDTCCVSCLNHVIPLYM